MEKNEDDWTGMDKEETAGSGQGKRGYILTYRESETDIIIMEICKAPTLRLKAHRKRHTQTNKQRQYT